MGGDDRVAHPEQRRQGARDAEADDGRSAFRRSSKRSANKCEIAGADDGLEARAPGDPRFLGKTLRRRG